MKPIPTLLLAALAAPAAAQIAPPTVLERQLLERQQRQDELILRMQQAQEAARPGLTARQREALERAGAEQLRQLQDLQREQQVRQLHLETQLPALPPPVSDVLLRAQNRQFVRETDGLLQRLREEQARWLDPPPVEPAKPHWLIERPPY